MNSLMTFTLYLLCMQYFLSCNNSQEVKRSDARKKNMLQSDSNTSISQKEDEEKDGNKDEDQKKEKKEVIKIDPSTLKIFTLEVANLASQNASGKIQNILRMDVSGETEYIYILICPLEDTGKKCSEGRTCIAEGAGQCQTEVTPLTRLILEPLYSGDIQIKAKACIKQEKSLTDENCSKYKTTIYNSKRANDAVIAKFNERAKYKEAVNYLIHDHRAYLQIWMEQSEKCKKQNAEAAAHIQNAIDITEMFLGAPTELIVDTMLENPLAEAVSPYAKDFGNMVSKGMRDACKDWDKEDSDPTCAKIAGFLSKLEGFADGMMNPMTSVGVLIDACNTISDPKSSVIKGCDQQKKLSIAHQRYYTQLEIAIRGYKRLNAELKELGEL